MCKRPVSMYTSQNVFVKQKWRLFLFGPWGEGGGGDLQSSLAFSLVTDLRSVLFPILLLINLIKDYSKDLSCIWQPSHGMPVNTRDVNSTRGTVGDVLLVEFTYFVFTCMPGEGCHRQFRSLLLFV